MADDRTTVQPAAAAAPAPATGAPAAAAPARLAAVAPKQASTLGAQTRNRVLFGIFVAFLVLYPVLDRGLGLGRLGSMNPILIYTLLALGLNIVVGFAGLLDLGYAAFFAIGGYTVAFLTA